MTVETKRIPDLVKRIGNVMMMLNQSWGITEKGDIVNVEVSEDTIQWKYYPIRTTVKGLVRGDLVTMQLGLKGFRINRGSVDLYTVNSEGEDLHYVLWK